MNAYVLLAPGDAVVNGDQILAVDGQLKPSGLALWDVPNTFGMCWEDAGLHGVKVVSGNMQVRRLLSMAEKTYHERYGYFHDWMEGDEAWTGKEWMAIRREDTIFGRVRRLMSKMYKAYTFHDDVPVAEEARAAADYFDPKSCKWVPHPYNAPGNDKDHLRFEFDPNYVFVPRGQVRAPGDEVYFGRDENGSVIWKPIGPSGRAFGPIRRKISDDSWRILEDREMVTHGDEVLCDDLVWRPASDTLGCLANRLTYRRKVVQRAAVKPGDGYRLLSSEEVIQEGDEFLSEIGNWIRTTCFGQVVGHDAFYLRCPYRRRIESKRPTVDPGAGYRLLDIGEVREPGDEFFGVLTKEWYEWSDVTGRPITPGSSAWRRKIKQPDTPTVDPGPGYRLLKEGEAIDEGDEYWANGWHKTTCAGKAVCRDYLSRLVPYRRKINPILTEQEWGLVMGCQAKKMSDDYASRILKVGAKNIPGLIAGDWKPVLYRLTSKSEHVKNALAGLEGVEGGNPRRPSDNVRLSDAVWTAPRVVFLLSKHIDLLGWIDEGKAFDIEA